MAVQLATAAGRSPAMRSPSIKEGPGAFLWAHRALAQPIQWIDAEWDRVPRGFSRRLNVMVENHRGVLAKVASEIAEAAEHRLDHHAEAARSSPKHALRGRGGNRQQPRASDARAAATPDVKKITAAE